MRERRGNGTVNGPMGVIQHPEKMGYKELISHPSHFRVGVFQSGCNDGPSFFGRNNKHTGVEGEQPFSCSGSFGKDHGAFSVEHSVPQGLTCCTPVVFVFPIHKHGIQSAGCPTD
jgi:hypothetical protein